MADNTLNFDLDAPAVPTLTLDPTPATVPQEEKPAAAPAPEAQVTLTPEEQAMVDQFAQKIDITNSQQVLQYGSACQKKIGDFSEAALSKVSTKDLGEVGDMITDLIGELKSFDANEEQQKGIMGIFKKKTSQLDALKTKYDKTETNVEKIQSMLEAHQVQLLKDIAMLDKMYELNMAYFKELSMYILAGKKKLADVRANELQQALDKAGCFALPALYASLQAPARRIYPEEAREYLRLAPQAGEGFVRLQAAGQMQVLYSSLQVAADGAPAALLLTEECTRSVTALQLLPPFVWEDPLPPLPDVPAALTLQLTVQDVEAIDADPAALGRRLVGSPAGKCWRTHPKAETFLAERVALLQRVYRR